MSFNIKSATGLLICGALIYTPYGQASEDCQGKFFSVGLYDTLEAGETLIYKEHNIISSFYIARDSRAFTIVEVDGLSFRAVKDAQAYVDVKSKFGSDLILGLNRTYYKNEMIFTVVVASTPNPQNADPSTIYITSGIEYINFGSAKNSIDLRQKTQTPVEGMSVKILDSEFEGIK